MNSLMQKHCRFCIFLLLASSCVSECFSSLAVPGHSGMKDFEVTSTGQCGAALEGDTGLITYSGPLGSVEPDELCIWTVHLLTTSTIRLNVTDVDFNGGGESCTDGSLRTYSLTNLVQGDNMESYTICPENQGSERILFLSDNAMVVTFRTSNGTNQGGRGFSLSWEGIKYASPQIAHASSISTLPDGIIRYPIRGEYNPNTLSTWLINLNRENNFPSLDLEIIALDIETCTPGLPDLNCFCDAAVIYEITGDGKMREMRRFCGQLAFPAKLEPSNNNFVVAFFSDSVNVPGVGSGLELTWTTSQLPTEPTTEPTGPTTPKPDVISTTCNGIVDLMESQTGRISYSNVQTTANQHEVCTWTIRANGSPNITLELDYYSSTSEEGNDLDVHSLMPLSGTSLTKQRIDGDSGLITLSGPITIVTFQSSKDRPVGSTANFQLAIKRVESSDGEPGYPIRSNYTDGIFETDSGVVKYPESGSYGVETLSTFVINPTTSNDSSYIVFKFDFVDTDCFDPLDVFILDKGEFVHQKRVCSDDRVTEYLASNVILLRFGTDRSSANDGVGFEASWFTKFPGPSTTCGGIIDLSRDVGKIEYSESAADRGNEQCVWTLRGTSSRTITFSLEEYSVQKCVSNGLYATGFTGNYSIGDTLRTEMKVLGDCTSNNPQLENEEVVMQGPVAFLVFVRNPGTIKVNIHYEPNLNEMEFPYLSNYTDKIGTEENGTLRYPGPAGWPRFNPSEWGTFVVNPLNRNSTSRIALKFTSLDLGQAGSCWSANVMTYDLRDGLVFQYMVCGGQTNTEILGDRTIVVLLRTGEPWSLYANTVMFNWWPRNLLD